MSYADQTEIEAEFKGIVIASGSAVTPANIVEWCTQASNYIDARIGLRYRVPVLVGTSPIGFNILRMICTFLVAERVKNKLEVKSNVSQKDSMEKFIPNEVMTPKDDLDLIVKGDLLLPDVPLVGSQLGIASFSADFDPCCRTFDVCKDQW